MQNINKISFEYLQYPFIDNLPEPLNQLSKLAIEASQKAYAPYSGFKVGAAVLLENGIKVLGNNQENAAYPSGLCAERTALFSANANYPDVNVTAIAICAFKNGQMSTFPVAPCGACRQVMLETEIRYNKPITVVLIGQTNINVIKSAHDLLPLSFNPKDLM
jgi:cytidine deaminase